MKPFPPDEWFEQRGVSVDTVRSIREAVVPIVRAAPKLPAYARVELASVFIEIPLAA